MRNIIGTLTAILAIASFGAAAEELEADGGSALVAVHATDSTDSDQDGLSDAVEALLRTNKNNSDTDNDGIDDEYEVRHGLNPLNPKDANDDEDNDGLTNYDEYRIGTNVFAVDTDQDGWYDSIELARGTAPDNKDDAPVRQQAEDADADGKLTAVDIQLVVNGALEIPVRVPANINGVGMADAIDVQMIINAVLSGM